MNIIDQLIPMADAHQAADEYIAGAYWDFTKQKGCLVGCSIKDLIELGVLNGVDYGDHVALAKATDVPEMLWRLSDHIFEGLPPFMRPAWTPRFLRAIQKATDIQNAPARIMARLSAKLADDAIRADVRESCKTISILWSRRSSGDEPLPSEWDAVRKQADASWMQGDASWKQAYAAWKQACADAARKQADAALDQADAASKQFWVWCAEITCDEIAA